MKKRTALFAALFLFAFPAAAGARLVINAGMFGVSLGDTMKQIRHKLGRPSEVDRGGGITSWYYDSRALLIDFRGNRVHDLMTINPTQTTASGIGAGSTEIAVMRDVPGVQCAPTSWGPRGTDCTVASGHVLTDFHITSRRGRVQSVLITQKP